MDEIKRTILEAIPDAEVIIEDPDGIHLEATVISPSFKGKTLVQQHKMVMQCLKKHFQTSLHALTLCTLTGEKNDK